MTSISALKVSFVLLHKLSEQGIPCSVTHLQGLLYLLQARYLVEEGQPLFSDAIVKQAQGPGIPTVQTYFSREHGAISVKRAGLLIRKPQEEETPNYLGCYCVEGYQEDWLSAKDVAFIESFIRKVGDEKESRLKKRLQRQTIWQNDRRNIQQAHQAISYDWTEITAHFLAYPKEQIWKREPEQQAIGGFMRILFG
jgi:hypothetical protein